ncbi:MAG: urea ABC transporter permease subunit UrtB [Hydrogenophaga sp.]|uniref:urea ABC transporter permease subunit UrtB n=1 Tax=Hydrogenophaga sp. TaxID=1904254 RepID=UPI00272FD137|nr:urea ABC transporter permease subunit UrtB [Hydrogenophaga sp.]MDP2407506.1 urea ABC transporter permease subunit UrtB [Hydrogenophaga sp.]MDZ4173825.1 urea ABC transporter permease subunit UrtB [Hydrogenophaga sp.]
MRPCPHFSGRLLHGALRLLATGCLAASGLAHALTPADAQLLASGESDERIATLNRLALATDDKAAATLIQAMADEAVRVQGTQVLIVRADISDTAAVDAVTGEAVALTDEAEDVTINNRMRGALETALAGMQLVDGDPERQRAAALTLQRGSFDEPDVAQLPLIERALATDLDPKARQTLELAQAAVLLASEDEAQRLAAAQKLGETRQPVVRPLLLQRLEVETSPAVKGALQASLAALDRTLAIGSALAQAFTGISLGSILLLAALGLAITYGLMGVINMAHGELIMIGAYATWGVQALFRNHLPAAFDWYLLAALPVAFMASALVGAAMERTVIRFLYGRPLETLLATWGISLVLMQGVRSLFGAQNVGVENPSWMSGGVTLLGNLNLPWNRIVIIAFAAAVLIGVTLLITRTRLGLFVRGVTQNRPIASCMGVNTARIDTYAFALGSGIAGLAGCALSQIGNVGPDLGQNYIVDSFMVVVLGGVGQLAGTVYAALGLGLLNKFIEGWAGAVLAKIAVLVFIIVFIQKRPQGIFAMKGRSAEA